MIVFRGLLLHPTFFLDCIRLESPYGLLNKRFGQLYYPPYTMYMLYVPDDNETRGGFH